MPCYCPEPNERDKESQLVCKLLVYLYEQTGKCPYRPDVAQAKASIPYEQSLDQNTARLCSKIKELTSEQLDRIVYDGRSAPARRLADWWDKHQEQDRKREAREAEQRYQQGLRKQGLAKLTNDERKALGL